MRPAAIREVRIVTYKLLCAYAQQFGKDFPISSVMGTMNAYEATEKVQECIETNTAYVVPTAAATAETTK